MTEDAPAAAERIATALVAAWNAHDADAFAASFIEDAEFANFFGMRARGRAEVAALHRPIFATMFKESRLAATVDWVRQLRDDVAAADLRWEMTGARGADGSPWPRRRGLMSMVLTRAGGAWAIALFHNMDLPPEDRVAAQERLQRCAAAR